MTRQGGVISRDYHLVSQQQAAEELPERSHFDSLALTAEVARTDQRDTVGNADLPVKAAGVAEVAAMKEVAVPIADATYDRLQALAARTGLTPTFYIQQAIEEHLEDLEDAYDAEQAAIQHHKSGERTLSLDDFERYRDLDD